MRFLSFIFVALFVFTSVASAQMTISRTDFSSRIGKSKIITTHSGTEGGLTTELSNQIKALVDKNGTGQTWDFTSFTFENIAANTNTISSTTTGATGGNDSHFASANFVVRDIEAESPDYASYQFYALSDASLNLLGETTDKLEVLLKSSPTPATYVRYQFPVTMSSSWECTSYDQVLNEDSIGVAFPVTMDNHIVIKSEVDGEGTLVLPTGSVNVLRLKITVTRTTSKATASGVTFTDENVHYEFMNKEKELVARLAEYHTHPNAKVATYLATSADASYYTSSTTGVRDNASSDSPLQLSLNANPVTKPTSILFTLPTESQISIQAMDELGREVRLIYSGVGHIGNNSVILDPVSFANGNYFLRVTSGNVAATQKFIIAK